MSFFSKLRTKLHRDPKPSDGRFPSTRVAGPDQHNAQSPLLIVELLHCIFEVDVLDVVKQTQGEYWNTGAEDGLRRLLELSKLSRVWRKAALTSGLWVFLYIPCVNPRLFKLLRARVGERDRLRLCVDGDISLEEGDLLDVKKDMARVSKFCLILSKIVSAQPILDILSQPAPTLESLTLSQTEIKLSEHLPESLVHKYPRLRPIQLVNFPLSPQPRFTNLTALHLESTTTTHEHISLETVDSWLSLFCSSRTSLISLHLLGVGCDQNATLSDLNSTLPSSLSDFRFSGDLKSCARLQHYSFPEGCNIEVKVTGLLDVLSLDDAQSLEGVSSWMWKRIDGKAMLKGITIAAPPYAKPNPRSEANSNSDTSDSNITLFCIVRQVTEVASVTLSLANEKKEDTMEFHGPALFKQVLLGLTGNTSKGVRHNPAIGDHTLLELSVLASEAALRIYGNVLYQYLQTLGEIRNLHIPHLKDRFNEYLKGLKHLNAESISQIQGGKYSRPQGQQGQQSIKRAQTTDLNPYQAMGLFSSIKLDKDTATPASSLFPSLKVIQLSHFNPWSRAEAISSVARFLSQRARTGYHRWDIQGQNVGVGMPAPDDSLHGATMVRRYDWADDVSRLDSAKEEQEYCQLIGKQLSAVLTPGGCGKVRN